MVNIQDVAKLAGVSVASVSRMLNSTGTVSPKTCEKISQAVAQLGYKPNMLGRNLRTRRTRIVLAILPAISNTFYSGIIRGMERVCDRRGYHCMVCQSMSEPEKEREYLGLVQTSQADGAVILYGSLQKEEYQSIWKKEPVIWCSEYVAASGIPVVSIDNVKSAKDGVEYLIRSGHQNIGLIGVSGNVLSAQHREIGYKKALEGAALQKHFVEYGDYSYGGGYAAAKRLVEKCPDLTALLAVSDLMAMGAIAALIDSGQKVPEDISVMGFDNIGFSRIFTPSLSTIAQPRVEMGQRAMDMLIDRVENPDIAQKDVLMEHRLVLRQSTRERK